VNWSITGYPRNKREAKMAKQKQAEFLKWMGPCLDALRKLGGSGTPQEVSDTIADELNLPDEKREELTASGIPRFHNQVCWARQYLVWEGYIESSKRGIWKLSLNGAKIQITDEDARKIFLKWVDIYSKKRKAKKQVSTPEPEQLEIEETYDETAQSIGNYKEELITILRSLSPRGFEELCLLLLRENGLMREGRVKPALYSTTHPLLMILSKGTPTRYGYIRIKMWENIDSEGSEEIDGGKSLDSKEGICFNRNGSFI
jgi:restriction system protein